MAVVLRYPSRALQFVTGQASISPHPAHVSTRNRLAGGRFSQDESPLRRIGLMASSQLDTD